MLENKYSLRSDIIFMGTHVNEIKILVPLDLTVLPDRYSTYEPNSTPGRIAAFGIIEETDTTGITTTTTIGYSDNHIKPSTSPILTPGFSYYHRDYIGLFLSRYLESELKRNPDVLFNPKFQNVLQRIIYYDDIRSKSGIGGICTGTTPSYDGTGTVDIAKYCIGTNNTMILNDMFAALPNTGADPFDSKKYYPHASWDAWRASVTAIPALQTKITAYFGETTNEEHKNFLLDIAEPVFKEIVTYEDAKPSGEEYGFESVDKLIGSINGMLTSINDNNNTGYGDRISTIEKIMAIVIRYLDVFLSTTDSYSLQLDTVKNLERFWETLRFKPESLEGAVEKPPKDGEDVVNTSTPAAKKLRPTPISGLQVLTEAVGVKAHSVDISVALDPVQKALRQVSDIPESDTIMTLVRGSIYRDASGQVKAGYLNDAEMQAVRDAALARSKKYLDAITYDTDATPPGVWTNRLLAYQEKYPNRQTGGKKHTKGAFVKPFMSGGAAISLDEITKEIKLLERETESLQESLALVNTKRDIREATVFSNPDLNGLTGLQQRNEYFVDMMNVLMGYTKNIGNLASVDAYVNQTTNEKMDKFAKDLTATWNTVSKPTGLTEKSKLLVNLQAQGAITSSQIKTIVESIVETGTKTPEFNPVLRSADEIRLIRSIRETVGDNNIPKIVDVLNSIARRRNDKLMPTKPGSLEDMYRDLVTNYAEYQDSAARADTVRSNVIGSVTDMQSIREFTGETVSSNLRSINAIGNEIINLGAETTQRSLMRRQAKIIGDRYKTIANKINDYLKTLKENLKTLQDVNVPGLTVLASNFDYEKIRTTYIDNYLNKLITSSNNLIPYYGYQAQINQVENRKTAIDRNNLELTIVSTAVFEDYDQSNITSLTPRISKTYQLFDDSINTVNDLVGKIMDYLSKYSSGENAMIIRLFPKLYGRLEFPVIIRNLIDSFTVVDLKSIQSFVELINNDRSHIGQVERDDLLAGALSELYKMVEFTERYDGSITYNGDSSGPNKTRIIDLQSDFSRERTEEKREEITDYIKNLEANTGITEWITGFFTSKDVKLQRAITDHVYQSASLLKLPLRTEDGAVDQTAIDKNLKTYVGLIRRAAALHDASLIALFDEKLQEKYHLLESTVFIKSGQNPYFSQIREDHRLARLASFEATKVGLVSDRAIIIPTADGKVPNNFDGEIWMPNLVVANNSGTHLKDTYQYLIGDMISTYEQTDMKPDFSSLLNNVNTSLMAPTSRTEGRPYTLLSAENFERKDRDLIFSQMDDFIDKTMPFLRLMKSMLDQNVEIINSGGVTIENECKLVVVDKKLFTNPFLFSVKNVINGADLEFEHDPAGYILENYSRVDNVTVLVPNFTAAPIDVSTPLEKDGSNLRCFVPNYKIPYTDAGNVGKIISELFDFQMNSSNHIDIASGGLINTKDVESLITILGTASISIDIIRRLTPLIEPLRILSTELPGTHNAPGNIAGTVQLERRYFNKRTLLGVLPEMIEIDKMIQKNLSRAPALVALNAGVGILKDAFNNCFNIIQDLDPNAGEFNSKMVPVWLFTRKIIALWYMICGHILTNIIVHGVGVTITRVIGCLPMDIKTLVEMNDHKKLFNDSKIHTEQIFNIIKDAQNDILRKQASFPIAVGKPGPTKAQLEQITVWKSEFEKHREESTRIKTEADKLVKFIEDKVCKREVNDFIVTDQSDIQNIKASACDTDKVKNNLQEKINEYFNMAKDKYSEYKSWNENYQKGTEDFKDFDFSELENIRSDASKALDNLKSIVKSFENVGKSSVVLMSEFAKTTGKSILNSLGNLWSGFYGVGSVFGGASTEIDEVTRRFVYNFHHTESNYEDGEFQWFVAFSEIAKQSEIFFIELGKNIESCKMIRIINEISNETYIQEILNKASISDTKFDDYILKFFTTIPSKLLKNSKGIDREGVYSTITSRTSSDHTSSFMDFILDDFESTSRKNNPKSLLAKSIGDYAKWDGKQWSKTDDSGGAENKAKTIVEAMTGTDFIIGVNTFTDADPATRINALKYAKKTYFDLSKDYAMFNRFLLSVFYHFIVTNQINLINEKIKLLSKAYAQSKISDLKFDEIFKTFVDSQTEYLQYNGANETKIKKCDDNSEWNNVSILFVQNANNEQQKALEKIGEMMDLISKQKDSGNLIASYEETLKNYHSGISLEDDIEGSIKKSSSDLSGRIIQYKRMTTVASMIIFNPYYRQFAMIEPDKVSEEINASITNHKRVLQMVSDNLGYIWDEFIMNQIRQTQFECYSAYRLALGSLIGGKSAIELVYNQMSFGLIEFYYDILDTIVGCLDGKIITSYNEVEDYLYRYHYITIKRCHALFRWIMKDYLPELKERDNKIRESRPSAPRTFDKKIIVPRTSAEAKEIFGEFMGIRTLLDQYRSITMDKVQLHLRINDFLSRGYNDEIDAKGTSNEYCQAIKELDPTKKEYTDILAAPLGKMLFYNNSNTLQVDFEFLGKVRKCAGVSHMDNSIYYSSINKRMKDTVNSGIPFERIYNTADFPSSDVISNYMSIAPNIVGGKGTVLMTYGYSGTGKSASLFGISDLKVNGILQSTFDQFNLDSSNNVIFMRVYEIYGFGTQYNYYWNPANSGSPDCFPDFSQYIIHHKVVANGDNLQSTDRAFMGNRHDAFNYIMQMKVPDENSTDRAKVPWFLNDKRTGNYQAGLSSITSTDPKFAAEVKEPVYIKITKDNYKNFDSFIKSIDNLRKKGSQIENFKKHNLTQIKETVNNPESSRSILVYDFQICLNYAPSDSQYKNNVWVPFLIYDLPGKEDIYRTFVDPLTSNNPKAAFSDPPNDSDKARKSAYVSNPIMIPAFDTNSDKIAQYFQNITMSVPQQSKIVSEVLNMNINSFGYNTQGDQSSKILQIKKFYDSTPANFKDLFDPEKTILKSKSPKTRFDKAFSILLDTGNPAFVVEHNGGTGKASSWSEASREQALKEIFVAVQIPLIAILIKYQYFDIVVEIINAVSNWQIERIYAFFEAYYINENVVGLLKYLLKKILIRKKAGDDGIALQTSSLNKSTIVNTVSKYYEEIMRYRFVKFQKDARFSEMREEYRLSIPSTLITKTGDPLRDQDINQFTASLKTKVGNQYAQKGKNTSQAFEDAEKVIAFSNRSDYDANKIFRGYNITCGGTPAIVDPTLIDQGKTLEESAVQEVNRPLLQDFIEPYAEKISFYYLFYVLSNTAHTRKAEEQVKLLSNSMPFIEQMDPAAKKSKCLE
jgi:hypothetical protein